MRALAYDRRLVSASRTIELAGAGVPAAVDEAAPVLLAGGVVVLPTDTVYGLAALPGIRAATDRLFALKARSESAPIAVLCADAGQALALAATPVGADVRAVAERWWPGPLTLVLGRNRDAALHLGEPAATIGLRVPDHELLRALAERVGPIAATSANVAGQPPAPQATSAAASLAGEVDLVVDGGALDGTASTVLDTTVRPWRVLRPGPLPVADLLAVAAATAE